MQQDHPYRGMKRRDEKISLEDDLRHLLRAAELQHNKLRISTVLDPDRMDVNRTLNCGIYGLLAIPITDLCKHAQLPAKCADALKDINVVTLGMLLRFRPEQLEMAGLTRSYVQQINQCVDELTRHGHVDYSLRQVLALGMSSQEVEDFSRHPPRDFLRILPHFHTKVGSVDDKGNLLSVNDNSVVRHRRGYTLFKFHDDPHARRFLARANAIVKECRNRGMNLQDMQPLHTRYGVIEAMQAPTYEKLTGDRVHLVEMSKSMLEVILTVLEEYPDIIKQVDALTRNHDMTDRSRHHGSGRHTSHAEGVRQSQGAYHPGGRH